MMLGNFGETMNYQNAVIGSGLSEANSSLTMRDRTVGQNIEAQIQTHKDEIVRLEGIRSKLSNGATLLDLSINDLQSAMRY